MEWEGTVQPQSGYPIVRLNYNGERKAFRVNRYIAFAVANPDLSHEEILELCRIDKQTLSCHSCDNPPCINPEHVTLGDAYSNRQDAFKRDRAVVYKGEQSNLSKLTEAQAIEIKQARGAYNFIGKKFGVTGATVRNIKTGRTWSHLP